MPVSWNKEHRDRAKQEAMHLFAAAVDARPDPKSRFGKMEVVGVCTEAEAKVILDAITRVLEMQKART